MRAFNVQVFDDMISTVSTWYTSDEYNDLLGSTDAFAVAALTSYVAGVLPSLIVTLEHSCDGRNWFSAGGLIVATMQDNGIFVGSRNDDNVLLSFVRLKIILGGTNPECRLKLYVTGRSRGRATETARSRVATRVPIGPSTPTVGTQLIGTGTKPTTGATTSPPTKPGGTSGGQSNLIKQLSGQK